MLLCAVTVLVSPVVAPGTCPAAGCEPCKPSLKNRFKYSQSDLTKKKTLLKINHAFQGYFFFFFMQISWKGRERGRAECYLYSSLSPFGVSTGVAKLPARACSSLPAALPTCSPPGTPQEDELFSLKHLKICIFKGCFHGAELTTAQKRSLTAAKKDQSSHVSRSPAAVLPLAPSLSDTHTKL